MSNDPLVSIVMASYNHADYIGKAIDSVLEQDYERWELLIADDASDDGTAAVLDSYVADPRIKVFPFKINRQYHMRNFACAKASGKYIAFLNSDDLFFPGKLRKQVQVMEGDSSLAAAFTHVQCIDEQSRPLRGHGLEVLLATANRSRHQWLRTFFEKGNCLCLASAFIRRDLLNEIGLFNPLLIQIADLDLWVRICFKAPIHVIPEALTGRRILPYGRNLSAPGPAVYSRLSLEYQHVYSRYFSDDALLKLNQIFPEILSAADEDLQTRFLVLCQKAVTMRQRYLRQLGFIFLHKLLMEDETRNRFLELNPRLLRHLFLTEGTAGLHTDEQPMAWNFSFQQENTILPNTSSCFWTAPEMAGVFCFSLPNPKTRCRLLISNKGTGLLCRRVRLYEQQTANLICTSPTFDLPMIDFSIINSNSIDVEIEMQELNEKKKPSMPRRLVAKMKAFIKTFFSP